MSRTGSVVPEVLRVDVGTRSLIMAIVLIVAQVPSSRAESLFVRSLALGAGSNPYAVAIADVDHDGRPDLLVANYGSSTVSVVLGRADGSYAAGANVGVGSAPCALAVADLNGDGAPDLAVTNAASNTVSLLPGNGDGTFGAAKSLATGINPCAVAVADLNADGRPDLLVANLASNTISVFLGRAGGEFADRIDVGAGTSPRALSLGDLNGDGRVDLVVANQFGVPLSILLGMGDGTFATRRDYNFSTRNPSAVAIADLNGDGHPDVAVAGGAYDEVSVLFGLGDGTVGPSVDVACGPGPTSLVVADFNRDGRLDMATTNGGANTISVLLQNAAGTFDAEPDFNTGEFPSSLATADLDGDGRLDLVAANDLSNSVSMFLSQPPPVPMAFSLRRHNLDLDSGDRWVKALLEPPPPFAANDIDVHSILLNGAVSVDRKARSQVADHDHDGVRDLLVRFRRKDLARILSEGHSVVVTVTGMVAGHRFMGTNHVRVEDLTAGAADVDSPPATDPVALARRDPPILAIRGLTPNPANAGWMRVDFALGDAGAARLELLDVAGRAVASRDLGGFVAGAHSISLEQLGALPPGVYFLRLRQGTHEVRARATVLR